MLHFLPSPALFRTVGLAAAVMASLPASAALIVNDPVQSNDGWNVSGNTLHFLGACCGTAPTAGTEYLHIQNFGGRVASKTFSGLNLAAGTYVVTFDMGSFNNQPFSILSGIGLTAGGGLLLASAATVPTPAQGQVLTWTVSYEVTLQHVALGQSLGFSLEAPDTGAERNASFDNLRIDFVAAPTPGVPEPGMLAMVGLALAAAAAARRRPA